MNENNQNAFNLVLVRYFCIKFLKRCSTKLEISKRGWKRKTGWSFSLHQVTYLSNLSATDSISTALRLTYLFLSTKLRCKPYFSNDKSKNTDDKLKTETLCLSLGNLLNLIFKFCGFLFLHITCLVFSCRNTVNTLKEKYAD